MQLDDSNLKVSKCGCFAMILNSTGARSVVWSKSCAQKVVKNWLTVAVITQNGGLKLLSQIKASSLPDTDDQVPVEVRTAIANLNRAISLPGYKLTEEMIDGAIDLIRQTNKPPKNRKRHSNAQQRFTVV